MTEQEFITGVADGTLLKVDIYKYCEDVSKMFGNDGLNDILDELFAESLSYHTHQIVFVEGTDEIKDYGGVSVADQTKINRLLDAMGLIEARYGIDWGNSKEQPQTTEIQEKTERPTEGGLYLPLELLPYKGLVDTPKARKCFDIAISKGLIEKTENGYRKCKGKSKALLAYFLQNVYVDVKNGGTFPNTALNLLFGVGGLKQAASKVANNKHGNGRPKGYELVDDILTEAERQLATN